MVTINTEQYDLATLNVYNPSTSTWEPTTLHGNIYTVNGVTDPSTGGLRRMSIGELVMVVCLARAAEKEASVISLMREMNTNTSFLEALTTIESKVLAGTSVSGITDTWTIDGTTYNATSLLNNRGINPSLGKDDLVSAIESKMDSMNSFSQQKMIQLQSETNKRDQSYDMITNILKSLNTVMTGNANNI